MYKPDHVLFYDKKRIDNNYFRRNQKYMKSTTN